MTPEVAFDHVQIWFDQPHVRALSPGSQHLSFFCQFIADAKEVGGNLVTDAHIAACAAENQAELHSNDSDFERFSGLRWVNPLAS